MSGLALLPARASILLLVLLPASGALAVSLPADPPAAAGTTPGFELNFTKGDTREGSKVNIRVVGDSLHYSRTDFAPGHDAVQSFRSAPLDIRRRIALKRILGELPRFQVFGSCHGEGMRFYMIDAPGSKFYRSLPDRAGRCFADEPGIWPLLEDLDTFIAPPADPEDPDYSAGAERPKS